MNMHRNSLACVVVDMQKFFLQNLTKENRERIVPNQIKVVDLCIKNKIPVIVLEYKGRGETIGVLKNRLKKVQNNVTIVKECNSGFRNTNLHNFLTEKKIKNLFIMGINASGCVQDTAIGALHRGYKIVTASTVIASASVRDRKLATSRKWFSKKGKYFESMEPVFRYLTNNSR